MIKQPQEPNPTPDPVPLPGSQPHALKTNTSLDGLENIEKLLNKERDHDLKSRDKNEEGGEKQDDEGDKDDGREQSLQRSNRFLQLGDTVYFGEGDGGVAPAIVTAVYPPAANDNSPLMVDLQVFGRQHITCKERVSQHTKNDTALTGWAFRG